jgi:hypothetical protein
VAVAVTSGVLAVVLVAAVVFDVAFTDAVVGSVVEAAAVLAGSAVVVLCFVVMVTELSLLMGASSRPAGPYRNG